MRELFSIQYIDNDVKDATQANGELLPFFVTIKHLSLGSGCGNIAK